MNDIPVEIISCVVALLLLAGLSAVLLRKLRFPYTIGLVVIGMLLGIAANKYDWLGTVGNIHLTPNIILYILLPTLVFDAAVNIDSRLLLKNLAPVLTLAAPGLIIATIVTGFLVTVITPLSLGPAMLFGGLISATDPVAVIAVFKELGAPKRLTMLVDGESLFNDATAIVAFDIILGLLVGGAAFGAVTIVDAGMKFIVVFAGGAIVGALIGYIMVLVLSLARDNPVIEIAFTTVIAYAAFIVAQFYLDLSGVMAVVGAGLVVSYYGHTRFTPTVKGYISQFWEFASFAANSYIFLLLGLTENYLTRDAVHLMHIGVYALGAVLVIQVARMVVVFGLVPLINRFHNAHQIGRRYQAIMFWGGLRGALPIGLAMSLSAAQVGGEQNRIMILDLTLGVVLFTLLIQGTTISKLMHWLGLDKLTSLDRREITGAEISSKQNAVSAIQKIEQEWPGLNKHVLEHVRNDLDKDLCQLHEQERKNTREEIETREMLWVLALSIVQRTIRSMFDLGFMPESVLRESEHVLDLRREDIKHGIIPPPDIKLRPIPEERINNILTIIIGRMAPDSRWSRYLRFRKVEFEFAVDLGITQANKILHQELEHLGKLSQTDSKQQKECQQYFDRINECAIQRFKTLMTEYNSELQILQERTVRQAALLAEENVLEEIIDNHAISSRAAGVVKQQIAERKKTVSNQVEAVEHAT